jgi:hypothetical protein
LVRFGVKDVKDRSRVLAAGLYGLVLLRGRLLSVAWTTSATVHYGGAGSGSGDGTIQLWEVPGRTTVSNRELTLVVSSSARTVMITQCFLLRAQCTAAHAVVDRKDKFTTWSRTKTKVTPSRVTNSTVTPVSCTRILRCVTASTAPYPRSFLFNSNKHP